MLLFNFSFYFSKTTFYFSPTKGNCSNKQIKVQIDHFKKKTSKKKLIKQMLNQILFACLGTSCYEEVKKIISLLLLTDSVLCYKLFNRGIYVIFMFKHHAHKILCFEHTLTRKKLSLLTK